MRHYGPDARSRAYSRSPSFSLVSETRIALALMCAALHLVPSAKTTSASWLLVPKNQLVNTVRVLELLLRRGKLLLRLRDLCLFHPF